MDKKLIAIIDDEPDILELVSLSMEKSGYDTIKFDNGADLLAALPKKLPDLLILDLMLPDMDGFDICKEIRKNDSFANLPIIMLTAKNDVTDRVLGLEFGADDYVVKPFSPRELAARVKAVLRRQNGTFEETKSIKIGHDLMIDLQKYKVTKNGDELNLTSTEYKILKMLSSRPGWVYSRNQMLDYLWGNDKIVIDRTIDVHVRNLRSKLGEEGKKIKNVRGVGYKLEL